MVSILLCDDSREMLDQLTDMIRTYFSSRRIKYRLTANSSPEELLKDMEQPDIAFIDVEMPGINGLELSRRLKEKNPDVLILIVTSYDCYLDDAMDIQVYRYLSKPVEKERFYHSLTCALREYQQIHREVLLSCGECTRRIPTREIVYIAIHGRKTLVRTVEQEYLCGESIRTWEQKLGEPQHFAYSHNSYLINLRYVVAFDRSRVTIQYGQGQTETLYVSQRKYAAFKHAFFEYMENSL